MSILKSVPVWKQAPFIRIIIPFIVGIILSWYLPVTSFVIIGVLVSSFILLLISSLASLQVKYYYGYLQGLLLYFLLMGTGASVLYHYKATNDFHWIGHQKIDQHLVIAELREAPIKKNKSFKLAASALALYSNKSLQTAHGFIQLYIQADTFVTSLETGDRIIFKPSFQPISYSGNPGAFNYREYLSYANVYIQSYLDSNSWVIVSKRTGFSFQEWLSRLQQSILVQLRSLIPNPKEQGLAEALLIGYKADLDKELLQAYSNTGVVHVIAISGLHLGLIYWLLNLIFYPFRKKKKAVIPVSLFILVGLWLFSLLSGASPSVLRSAVMFSFIIIGNCSSRKIAVYNSLAASACFLLCFNPCWLWDVGFQLSYIAVLSIVIFMKPIYHLLFIQNKLLDLLWQLSAVTLAAQILTTPMSIYHFHQFPMLFLFTNLIAVPLSSLILLGEVLLLSLVGLPPISKQVGIIIQWLIRLMNDYVSYMNAFPFSVWSSLSISLTQTLLLYFFIAALTIAFSYQKKSALYAGFLLLTLFFALRFHSFYRAKSQELLIVYNIPNRQAIDWGIGEQVTFVGDDSLIHHPAYFRQYLYPARSLYRLQDDVYSPGLHFFIVKGKTALLVDKNVYHSLSQNITRADILILSGNPRFSLEELQTKVVFKQLVLDATNKNYTIRKWKADCAKAGIDCKAVSVDGAFVVK